LVKKIQNTETGGVIICINHFLGFSNVKNQPEFQTIRREIVDCNEQDQLALNVSFTLVLTIYLMLGLETHIVMSVVPW